MAAATENPAVAPNTEDILKEVRNFVKGSSLRSKVSNEELARSALFLLRTLPSARQAVLEHLCTVFNDAVRSHLDIGNKPSNGEVSELDAVIQDVKDVMMGFIKSNPLSWAPIISAWAIELLGQISGEYTGQRAVPVTSSLNELLQLWMTCSPTSVLIEIASECFASMVGDMPDVCVSSLLEASVKHSPHFDWVVAHIGSCFPTTIITRVLTCGLKDFFTHGGDQSAPAVTEEKVPKLASVVGILGHLATQHRADIRTALTALFQASLRPDCEDMHVAAVPFLLHLASMSPLLLRVITVDFVSTVTPSVLNRLARQLTNKKAHVGQDKNQLVVMLVHLISTADVGSYKILQFLLDNAVPQPHKDDAMDTDELPLEVVQQTCATVMEHLLLELHQVVQRRNSRSGEVAFLLTLQDHVPDLCKQLIRAEGQRYEWLCHVLSCVAMYCDDSCAALILSTVIQEANESAQLGVFIRIQNEAQMFHPDVLALTSCAVLESLGLHQGAPLTLRNTLRNLLWVAQWEKKQAGARCTARHKLQNALHTGLASLTPCLYHADTEVAAVAMELLNIVGLPSKMGMGTMTKLCCATANFFFRCLHSPDGEMSGAGEMNDTSINKTEMNATAPQPTGDPAFPCTPAVSTGQGAGEAGCRPDAPPLVTLLESRPHAASLAHLVRRCNFCTDVTRQACYADRAHVCAYYRVTNFVMSTSCARRPAGGRSRSDEGVPAPSEPQAGPGGAAPAPAPATGGSQTASKVESAPSEVSDEETVSREVSKQADPGSRMQQPQAAQADCAVLGEAPGAAQQDMAPPRADSSSPPHAPDVPAMPQTEFDSHSHSETVPEETTHRATTPEAIQTRPAVPLTTASCDSPLGDCSMLGPEVVQIRPTSIEEASVRSTEPGEVPEPSDGTQPRPTKAPNADPGAGAAGNGKGRVIHAETPPQDPDYDLEKLAPPDDGEPVQKLSSGRRETAFVKLRNRIKELELNLNLSSRYLEELSQRYRRQMENMYPTLNKTIQRLINTSHIAEQRTAVKCQNARLCQRYMAALSDHVMAQRLLSRLLLQGTLSKEHAPVFGSTVYVTLSPREEVRKPTAQLLSSNRRRAPSNLPHGRARVFHGGVIGRGLKPLPRPSAYTQEEQLCNCHLVVEALWLCNTTTPPVDSAHTDDDVTDAPPSRQPGTIHPPVGRALALLLVELVAPDVMYNGIPWPEEDFMKVTVERNLLIRKMFDDNLVLWDFMEVLSHSPGAVVYCSALLRGVAATLIVQWDSCREKAAHKMTRHLVTSQRLMECLRKGALLSSPLSYVGELFPVLAPHEVCLLLQTVWRYIKENPPVPDPKVNLAKGCDRRYTDVVQSIIHTNIDMLGHVHARFNPRPLPAAMPPYVHVPPGHALLRPATPQPAPPIAERLMNHANSASSLLM